MDMDMDSIVNMDAVEEIHRLTDTQTPRLPAFALNRKFCIYYSINAFAYYN